MVHHTRDENDDTPLQPLWVIHLSISGITSHCNNQLVVPRMTPTDTSKKLCIPVYSRPPTIDDTYKTRTATQVANDVVDREPARWRSWTWVPRNRAMDMQFVEWVEGRPYSRWWFPTAKQKILVSETSYDDATLALTKSRDRRSIGPWRAHHVFQERRKIHAKCKRIA